MRDTTNFIVVLFSLFIFFDVTHQLWYAYQFILSFTVAATFYPFTYMKWKVGRLTGCSCRNVSLRLVCVDFWFELILFDVDSKTERKETAITLLHIKDMYISKYLYN